MGSGKTQGLNVKISWNHARRAENGRKWKGIRPEYQNKEKPEQKSIHSRREDINLIPTKFGQNDPIPHIYPYNSQLMNPKAALFEICLNCSFLPVK